MRPLHKVTIGIAATTMATGALATAGVGIAGGAPSTPRAAHAVAAHGVTVKTHHKKLGTYLVTGSGRSLYRFEKDNGSTSSHCYHKCAKDWPPLITHGKPHAAGKAKGSLLGTTTRKNGSKQVTYNGHPLYRFEEDHKAGQTRGEGLFEFGARWNVV